MDSNNERRRSDRVRRKIAEFTQPDQRLRPSHGCDESTTSRGESLSSYSYSTQDDRLQSGSGRSSLRSLTSSQRGIDTNALPPLMNSAPRRSHRSIDTNSRSTERGSAVLLEMSMDEEQFDDPADFGLSGPVVTVGLERTLQSFTPEASSASRFQRNVDNAPTGNVPTPAVASISKNSRTSSSQNADPTPGAYQMRGRAIGSLPAWVRHNSQQLFVRRPSSNNLDMQSRVQRSLRSFSFRSRSEESAVSSNVPPELRGATIAEAARPSARITESLDVDTNTPPELRGPMLSDQGAEEERSSVHQQDESDGHRRKSGYSRIISAVLVVLIICGVAGAVYVSIIASKGQSKNPVPDNAAITLSPSSAPFESGESLVPTQCSKEYDGLSGAHRVCICTGVFNDWGNDTDTVTSTVDTVLVTDPTLNSILSRLGYFDAGVLTCDPNVLALFWLAEDVKQNNKQKESWGQRFLLASLFMWWTQADPFRWSLYTNWLSAESECNWYGISCNDSGQVDVIRLPKNNLAGSAGLPIEVFMLTSLTSLDVSFNNMHITSIPSDISDLTNLTTLSLRSNQIGGNVSFEAFPASLVELRLERTDMKSEIHISIENLINLEILEMNNANVIGTIPSVLGALTKLRELYLGGNEAIQGGIPSEIGKMSSLHMFDMQSNSGMEITLVTEIGLLSGLVELNLDGACGVGPIPSEIGLLLNLTKLGLQGGVDVSDSAFSSRGFSGSIPSEIGNLSQLVSLNLGENNLIGQIPSEISQLRLLKNCDLGMNLLSGVIPSELASLTSIETLRLRGQAGTGNERNEIGGNFPSSLDALVNLNCLDVSGTLLTGSVPESFCDNSREESVFINIRCVGFGSVCSCCSCDAADECVFHTSR